MEQQNAWNELVQDWKGNEPAFDNQAPSESVLMTQLNKQKRNAKFEIALSVLISISVVGYIVSEMLSGLPSIADVILYSTFLVAISGWGLYFLFSARHYIVASTSNTLDYKAVLLKQTKAKLRALLVSRALCAVVLLTAMSLLVLIGFVGMTQGFMFKHYLVGGTALGCSLLITGFFVWSRREKSQIDEQIAFLHSLDA